MGRYERELRNHLRFDLNQILMSGSRDTASLNVLFGHIAGSGMLVVSVMVFGGRVDESYGFMRPRSRSTKSNDAEAFFWENVMKSEEWIRGQRGPAPRAPATSGESPRCHTKHWPRADFECHRGHHGVFIHLRRWSTSFLPRRELLVR